MRTSLIALASLFALSLTGCGPKTGDCLDNAGADCPEKELTPAEDPTQTIEDTRSREIWAGENGYGVFEVTQAGQLVGALHIVTLSAPQSLKDRAAQAGLQPGQEQWTWSASVWPAGPLVMTRKLNLNLPTQNLSRFTEGPFPSTVSAVYNTPLDSDDRLYRLSFADVGTVGWLRVEITLGVTTGLRWYKSVNAPAGPFLVVTETQSLTLTPAPVSELPATAYTIVQTVL